VTPPSQYEQADVPRQDVNIMKLRSDPGEPIRLDQMLQVEGEYILN